MPYPDLQSFLKDLEKRGQLTRIAVEVDPLLEISAITDRVSKMPAAGNAPPPDTDPVHGRQGGSALRFDKVKGSSIPVAINTFGSYERMKLALGVHSLEDLAARVQELVKPEIPTTLLEKVKKLPQLAKMAGYGPRVVKSGLCQQVVHTEKADLLMLPLIQCWPHDGRPGYGGKPPVDPEPRASARATSTDVASPLVGGGPTRGPTDPTRTRDDAVSPPYQGGVGGGSSPEPRASARAMNLDPSRARKEAVPSAVGPAFQPVTHNMTARYITFAGIYTKHPESGDRNVGMYRVQLHGPRLMAMHWHMHHDGARHFRKYKKRGERMPLAIVLGGEPVLTYAATCPLPPDVSELLFAGFLNDGGIELVPCRTIPMEVPCNAEIVIEGWVDPEQTLMEGPFGDHTGFYSLADRYPAFHVTAITHRRDPVYLTTIVGKPPQEDYYLGKATERIFLPLLRMLIPSILDYSLPRFGAFHNCVFVKIRKEYPLHARAVMSSIWGAGQMMFAKMIVVVDEHVNVHDEQDVLFHMGANVDWRRDTVIVDGPCDILDHATPYYAAGAKIGIDATRKIPGEGIVRDWPDELDMSADIISLIERRWPDYGL